MEEENTKDTLENFLNVASGSNDIQEKEVAENIESQESIENDEIQEQSSKPNNTGEQTKNKKEKTPEVDLKAEYDALKKRFDEARSWGHKQNSAYLHAKKNMTGMISELKENDLIDSEYHEKALNYFNYSGEDSNPESESKDTNPYIKIKENLDKELSMYQKYNKDREIPEKYNAFFHYFDFFSKQEQEEMSNYIKDAESHEALEYIILKGSDVYHNLEKGARKTNGVVPFVKDLNSQIAKLQKRNKELEEELDSSHGLVHNKSLGSSHSRQSPTKKTTTLQELWS